MYLVKVKGDDISLGRLARDITQLLLRKFKGCKYGAGTPAALQEAGVAMGDVVAAFRLLMQSIDEACPTAHQIRHLPCNVLEVLHEHRSNAGLLEEELLATATALADNADVWKPMTDKAKHRFKVRGCVWLGVLHGARSRLMSSVVRLHAL